MWAQTNAKTTLNTHPVVGSIKHFLIPPLHCLLSGWHREMEKVGWAPAARLDAHAQLSGSDNGYKTKLPLFEHSASLSGRGNKEWECISEAYIMLILAFRPSGHLRYSITERFKLTRSPMWTQNDQVTPAAVQEAAKAFLSRAEEDLGHDLPSQIQESLSRLQEHLLSISLQ